MLFLILRAAWQKEELMCFPLGTRTPPGIIKKLYLCRLYSSIFHIWKEWKVRVSFFLFTFLFNAAFMHIYSRLPQVLVPVCGFLLRALYLEARVHCWCFHGGSVLWWFSGDHLHSWYEKEDLSLRPSYSYCSPKHLPGCGSFWNPGGPLHAWGELYIIRFIWWIHNKQNTRSVFASRWIEMCPS